MRKALSIATAAALAAILGSSPLLAAKGQAVTGIDSIHAKVRVGGKLCFADHEHYGEAESATRGGAEAAARRKWSIFTADEYGTAWGNYAAAVAKTMNCSAVGARWLCKTTARPCRQ